MSTWKAIHAALREAFLGDWLADTIDRWLIKRHWPTPEYDEHDHVAAFCPACGNPWPCVEFLAIDQRIDERERARSV